MAEQDSVDLSEDPRAAGSSLSLARKPVEMKMMVKTTSVLAPHMIPNCANVHPRSASSSGVDQPPLEPAAKKSRHNSYGLPDGGNLVNGGRDESPLDIIKTSAEDQHASSRGSFSRMRGNSSSGSTATADSDRPSHSIQILGTYRSATCSNRFRDNSNNSNSQSYPIGESLSNTLSEITSGGELVEVCDSCQMPIVAFGRFIPCLHAPCFDCARRAVESTRECAACRSPIDDIIKSAIGSLFICNISTCHRAFEKLRDLRLHLDEAHRDSMVRKDRLPIQPGVAMANFMADPGSAAWNHQNSGFNSNANANWHSMKVQNGMSMSGRAQQPLMVNSGYHGNASFREDAQFTPPGYQFVSAAPSNQNYGAINVNDAGGTPPFGSDDAFTQFDPPGAYDGSNSFRMNGRLAGPGIGPGPGPGPFGGFRPGRPNGGPSAYLSPPMSQRRPLLPSPPLGGVGVGINAMHPSFTLRPMTPFEAMQPEAAGLGAFNQPFVGLHGYVGTPANGTHAMQPSWPTPNPNMSHNMP